jgi:hypothetical protein
MPERRNAHGRLYHEFFGIHDIIFLVIFIVATAFEAQASFYISISEGTDPGT